MIRRARAADRRAQIIDAAIACFAAQGYHATPVAEVAEAVGISQPYVFKLFPAKEALFVAALDRAFARIVAHLRRSVAGREGDAEALLLVLAEAYADLIPDRDLLMMQVHAESAADVPAIARALREGLAATVRAVRDVTGASERAVQRFMAFRQLCHLVAAARLSDLDDAWAQLLTSGIRRAGETDGGGD